MSLAPSNPTDITRGETLPDSLRYGYSHENLCLDGTQSPLGLLVSKLGGLRKQSQRQPPVYQDAKSSVLVSNLPEPAALNHPLYGGAPDGHIPPTVAVRITGDATRVESHLQRSAEQPACPNLGNTPVSNARNVDLILREIDNLSTRLSAHARSTLKISPRLSSEGVEPWTFVENARYCK